MFTARERMPSFHIVWRIKFVDRDVAVLTTAGNDGAEVVEMGDRRI